MLVLKKTYDRMVKLNEQIQETNQSLIESNEEFMRVNASLISSNEKLMALVVEYKSKLGVDELLRRKGVGER